MNTRERINDMPIDKAEELCDLLEGFKCGDMPCNNCPVSAEDGECMFLLLKRRIDNGLC